MPPLVWSSHSYTIESIIYDLKERIALHNWKCLFTAKWTQSPLWWRGGLDVRMRWSFFWGGGTATPSVSLPSSNKKSLRTQCCSSYIRRYLCGVSAPPPRPNVKLIMQWSLGSTFRNARYVLAFAVPLVCSIRWWHYLNTKGKSVWIFENLYSFKVMSSSWNFWPLMKWPIRFLTTKTAWPLERDPIGCPEKTRTGIPFKMRPDMLSRNL